MSVEAWELHTSRPSAEGEDPSVEMHWMIKGTSSDLVAKSVLGSASPLIYDALVRKSWRVEPEGHEMWRGFVHYGRYPKPQTIGDKPRISFDMGGGNIHVLHALETVNKYAPEGAEAIDSKGLIGVTRDRVESVDIPAREFHWSETYVLSRDLIEHTVYPLVLYTMKGTVNESPWRAYAAGEVLLANIAGGTRDNDTCEITYSFAASPNLTDLTIGDIQGIEKNGWDYLWVRWQDDVDDTAKALVKKPQTVYVDRVIKRTNFMNLGIG